MSWKQGDCFTGRVICWFDRVKVVIGTTSCTGNSGVTTTPIGIILTQGINQDSPKHSSTALMHSEKEEWLGKL